MLLNSKRQSIEINHVIEQKIPDKESSNKPGYCVVTPFLPKNKDA